MKPKLLTRSIYLILFCSLGLVKADEQAIEKMEVVGQRNQALTEPSAETKKLLAVAGIDGDPINSVYSLPGVVFAGGDFGGEPAIRGSSPEDNGFYIDSMPADYIFHLFGDSIFNKDLVRDFNLEAAAFGSEYGDVVGGVFDVSLRDPKNQDLTVKLDASLLKTGVLVESAVTENQAFYFSYRRSLIHLFYSEGDEEDGITVFDAPVSDDYQGKYQWLVGNEHKITFSVNGARDSGGINISAASEEGRIDPDLIGDASLNNGFHTQGVSWEYFPNELDTFSVAVNHVSTESREKYGAEQFVQLENDQVNFRGSVKTARISDHQVTLGIDAQRNDFEYSFDIIPYFCTDHDTNCIDQKGERIADTDNIKAIMLAAYLQDRWQITPSISLTTGLRVERDDYTEKTFVHPRANIQWFVSHALTLFAKAGKYSRFPDIDTALEKLGNPNIDPIESAHYATGAEYEFDDVWSTKVEIYHKEISKLARAVDVDAPNAEQRYTNDTSGQAHGIEWMLEKSLSDNWYGWLSVSWSNSERTDDILAVTTDYYLDTPLVVNAVANYQLNDHWDFGMRFTARSGAKYTPIIGIKANPDFPDTNVAVYGELNSETLPTYSRLDLQAKYRYLMFGNEAALTFAIINALNSENVSGYYFLPDGNETASDFNIEQEEGIGIFPSIGFEVTF